MWWWAIAGSKKLSTSCATSRACFAESLRSATPRSRSRAAIPAARSITGPVTTITRISTASMSVRLRLGRSVRLSLGQQNPLALQDPPRDRDSRRVRRVHPPVAQPASAQRARLRVRSVRRVVDDAKGEVYLGHGDALVQRVAVGLDDLVAGVEVWPRLHLDHGVAALVVEVEVVAILEERSSDGD